MTSEPVVHFVSLQVERLFERHGWSRYATSMIVGAIYMTHTNGDVILIHSDGRVEPLT